MLNNFCLHVYAQKSLFIAENCNGFFLTTTSSCEFRVHGAGSQLKILEMAQNVQKLIFERIITRVGTVPYYTYIALYGSLYHTFI